MKTALFVPLGVVSASALVLWASALGAQPAPTRDATVVALDAETTVNGVPVACTGVGQTKADPKWLAYSVRLEFSNPARDYLADEAVAVSDAKGRRLAAMSCEGPWILLKLPPGPYTVEGWLPGAAAATAHAAFRAPAKGQLRLVLVFPGQP